MLDFVDYCSKSSVGICELSPLFPSCAYQTEMKEIVEGFLLSYSISIGIRNRIDLEIIPTKTINNLALCRKKDQTSPAVSLR